jgi:hypothetical protein
MEKLNCNYERNKELTKISLLLKESPYIIGLEFLYGFPMVFVFKNPITFDGKCEVRNAGHDVCLKHISSHVERSPHLYIPQSAHYLTRKLGISV